MRFRINSPKVIHQVFDTEVVIVNLETGIYYSVRGSGMDIWRAIADGRTAEEISDAFASAGAPTREFIQELHREDLITPAEDEPATKPQSLLSLSESVSQPVLEKFTDMREMLLIDPIHELDEGGWPKKTSTE